MKCIVSRALIVKLSYSFSPFNPPFLRPRLLHSAAADDAEKHRNDEDHAFSSSLSRRQHDEDNRNVKVSVWWDFENCSIPKGVKAHHVASRITLALRSSGINGPVTIKAFGDVALLLRDAQEALTSTDICLTHVPHSGKNSADRSIMVDIFYRVSENPPPAHLFLISSDRDFANILHLLRMRNYNILISSTETASAVLRSAATYFWPWSGLVKGENVGVRHYNYPPDRLYGSWYGHYEGVLDDPFEDNDNRTTSQPEESKVPISEPKFRPVPKAVVNGIRQVLDTYPEGIGLAVLRTKLKRNNITIDNDFYGHNNFPQFLESLNLLKAISCPVGGVHTQVGGGQLGSLKKEAEQSSGGNLGTLKEGAKQPGGGQPGTLKEGAEQSCGGQPGTAKKGGEQPGGGQPGTIKEGAKQLGGGQLGTLKKGTEQPGDRQPGTAEKGGEQPGGGQLGTLKEGAKQPGGGQLGTPKKGAEQPGAGQQGTAKKGGKQPDGGQLGTLKGGAKQLGGGQLDALKKGT